MIRPVRSSSFARPTPTIRGSRCVPPVLGVTARRTSGSPSVAVSAATRRSQQSASSSPPPSASPSIAAIVGIGRPRKPLGDPRLALERLRAAQRAVGLELLHVRPDRERPLAAARHDDRSDVAWLGRLERLESRLEILEQRPGR